MITIFNIRPKGFNVGNDAIYIGMQHFLYNVLGEAINLISLPATSKYDNQLKAGLTAKTIHEINQYGDGVIVGGGNLYENGELDINTEALKALNVPLLLFSISRGRIYNRFAKLVDRTDVMPDGIIKALNDKAFVSLARDTATFNYLNELGCENLKLGGCPTIFLNKMEYRLSSINTELSQVAFISIRNPMLMNIPLGKQAKVRNDILDIVGLLKKYGYNDVRLLCHDLRDVEFASSFSGMEFLYTGDVYVYLNIIRSCAINITYRLHSALPCVAFGNFMIKISYDERACSLLETLGLGEWNINMVELDDVVGEVEKRLIGKEQLKKIVNSAKPIWDNTYSVMHGAFNDFAKLIKNRNIE